MRKIIPLLLAATACFPQIIPIPRVMVDPGTEWALQAADTVALVLGSAADSEETYAAQRLQLSLQRRLGLNSRILAESGAWQGYPVKVLVGVPTHHTSLSAALSGITVNDSSPGREGFVLHFGNANTVLLAGPDGNGVIYGQDALLQLFRKNGTGFALKNVEARDWPSINRRGHFSNNFEWQYCTEDGLDAHVMARFNLIDLRNGDFGTTSLASINDTLARRMMRMAKQRGFQVVGPVQSSISSMASVPGCINVFRQYRALYGVDVLMASFDDMGADTTVAESLLAGFWRLSDSLGLPDSDRFILPPAMAYDNVWEQWNYRVSDDVPDLKAGTWVLTTYPRQGVSDSLSMHGIDYRTWWHNWPRPNQGFTNTYYSGIPILAGDSFLYIPQNLKLNKEWTYGYVKTPDFETAPLRDAWRYTNDAIYWGDPCKYGQHEYWTMGFGLWAWNPESYDYEAARDHIRGYVFGPSKSVWAGQFDTLTAQLTLLYSNCTDLRGDTGVAESLLYAMAECAGNLRENHETLLPQDAYLNRYVNGMDLLLLRTLNKLGRQYVKHMYSDTGHAVSMSAMADSANPDSLRVHVVVGFADGRLLPMDSLCAYRVLTPGKGSVSAGGLVLPLDTGMLSVEVRFRQFKDTVAFDIGRYTTPPDSAYLLAWWKLDEVAGDTAYDASRNAHKGVLKGGPVWTSGKVDGALSLTSAQSVDMDTYFPELAMPFSMALWVNPGATQPNYAHIFGNPVRYKGVMMEQMGTTLNSFAFYYGDNVAYRTSGPVQLTAGQWQHLTVVCDGSNIILYLDGVERKRGVGASALAPNPGQVFRLGSFNGSLDDVRIYKRVLSQREIGELAAGNTGYRAPASTVRAEPLAVSPSPFNPAVAITLSFKSESLKIYDASGRLAADLSKKAGQGRVTWNASGFASGVYVITAVQGRKTFTKKVVFSK